MSDSELSEYEITDGSSVVDPEQETFSGKKANQAALKLARKLPAAESESAAQANPAEVTIRSVMSGAEFVFDAWAWKEETGDDADDWMPDETRKADIEPKSLDTPGEWFTVPQEAEQWREDH